MFLSVLLHKTNEFTGLHTFAGNVDKAALFAISVSVHYSSVILQENRKVSR